MTGTFSWESHFGKFYGMRKIGVATTFYPRSIREHWEHKCHIHRQYRSIVFGWLCSRFYQWVKCLHYEETRIDLGNKVLVAKAIFSLPNYFWRLLSWLPGKMMPMIAFVPSKMITKLADSIFIYSSSSTSSSYLIYMQCSATFVCVWFTETILYQGHRESQKITECLKNCRRLWAVIL